MTQEEFFKRFTYSVSADRIGGGGFGTVYKAKDHVLHRIVAIKVSEVKTTADGKKTFSLKDEFEALKHLSKHPNIANYEELYTFEDHRGICDYAVMQYYPDGNLSNAIKQGLTAQQKEDIAMQLLEGIAFLHKNKVVHRDLKPGNILVMKDDDGIIPIITDFGLSKAANIGDGSMFSNSFGAGTPRYSSPEQLQGKPLRLNTDLWSYGAILYELFTGEPLFSAGNGRVNSAQADLEIYNKIIHGDVEKLSKMPEKWHKVAERCLVVDADKRAKDEAELFRIVSGKAQKDVTVTDRTANASVGGFGKQKTETTGGQSVNPNDITIDENPSIDYPKTDTKLPKTSNSKASNQAQAIGQTAYDKTTKTMKALFWVTLVVALPLSSMSLLGNGIGMMLFAAILIVCVGLLHLLTRWFRQLHKRNRAFPRTITIVTLIMLLLAIVCAVNTNKYALGKVYPLLTHLLTIVPTAALFALSPQRFRILPYFIVVITVLSWRIFRWSMFLMNIYINPLIIFAIPVVVLLGIRLWSRANVQD